MIQSHPLSRSRRKLKPKPERKKRNHKTYLSSVCAENISHPISHPIEVYSRSELAPKSSRNASQHLSSVCSENIYSIIHSRTLSRSTRFATKPEIEYDTIFCLLRKYLWTNLTPYRGLEASCHSNLKDSTTKPIFCLLRKYLWFNLTTLEVYKNCCHPNLKDSIASQNLRYLFVCAEKYLQYAPILIIIWSVSWLIQSNRAKCTVHKCNAIPGYVQHGTFFPMIFLVKLQFSCTVVSAFEVH